MGRHKRDNDNIYRNESLLLDILVLSVRPGRNTAMRDRSNTDRLKRLLRTWDGDTMGTERVKPAGTDYTHNITTKSVKKAVER